MSDVVAFPAPTLTADQKWQIGADKAKAIEATRPPWAKAVIVADLEHDRSDSMSDYHATETVRRVVLAWSKHTRDLFPELRKAAASFPETAHMGPDCDLYRARIILSADVCSNARYYHKGESSPWHSEFFADDERYGRGKRFYRLAEAHAWTKAQPEPHPISFQTDKGEQTIGFEWSITRESIEHREKYSMGHGYYLSEAGAYGTGWRVLKTWKVDGHPNLETRIGASSSRPEAPAPMVGEGIAVALNQEHNGVELRFSSKPDEATRDRLKAAGWRWSRFSGVWYRKDTPDARAFACQVAGVPAIE